MSVTNDHKLAYDYHLVEASRGLTTAQILLSTELRRKAPDVSEHGTVADYRNLQVASLAVSDLLGAEVSDFERQIQAFPNTVDVWPFVLKADRLRVAHVLEDVVRHLEAAWRLRSGRFDCFHGWSGDAYAALVEARLQVAQLGAR